MKLQGCLKKRKRLTIAVTNAPNVMIVAGALHVTCAPIATNARIADTAFHAMNA